jgi:hypothetical protein
VRRENTLSCPRKGERLAWVEVASDGSRRVVVNAAAPGREALSSGLVPIPESEFSDEDGSISLSITATCPCGIRWSVNLAAVLHGEPQVPVRDTSDFPGVSFNRRRHRGG